METTRTIRPIRDGGEVVTGVTIYGAAFPYATATERAEGWVGSGFSARTSNIAARRVERDGRDELQITLKIATVYESGRMVTAHGSLCLDGEEADWLISQIEKPEARRAALAAAFEAGATSVHKHWTDNPGDAPRGDPEFSEAAHDYAASVA